MAKSPLRVLVVEDEPLLRWAISEILSLAGTSVSVAGDASSALRVMTESPGLDVVLLDLCLPDSRDLTLLSTIRGRWPVAAVVAMTAHAAPDVLEGVRALGVQTILAKPFDLHDVPNVLRGAFEQRHRLSVH